MRNPVRMSSSAPGPAGRIAVKYLPVATATALLTVLYATTRARHPGWGDGLGFLVSALDGFSWSVNATGHFLYANGTALIVRLFPGADPVGLLTVFSIVSALAAILLIYRAALTVTGPAASAAVALLLGLSFTFWRQAVSIEVYPLYLALLAGFLATAASDIARGSFRPDRGGILFGLALLTHIETVLLLPAFAWWCARTIENRPGRAGRILRATGWAGSALLLLVLAAAFLPGQSVAAVFVDYRFADEVFALSPRILAAGAVRSIAYLLYNFHAFIPVIILGAVILYRQSRVLFTFLALIVVPVWLFAFRYPVSDSYVFHLPAYLALAVAGAAGFNALFERLGRRWIVVTLAAVAILSPALYGVTTAAASRIPAIENPVRYKGGAAYYFWPGMRQVPDPLDLARTQLRTGVPPVTIDPGLWSATYQRAARYLQLIKDRRH